MILSKDDFAKLMANLKRIRDRDMEISMFFWNNMACNPETPYDDLFSEYLRLLKMIFNDTTDWIGYYIYELDFGEAYYDGAVTNPDGSTIKLETYEDLYELLTNK